MPCRWFLAFGESFFSFREVYVFAVSAGPVIAFDLGRTGHKRIVDRMEQAPRYPLWTPGAGTPLIRLRVARHGPEALGILAERVTPPPHYA